MAKREKKSSGTRYRAWPFFVNHRALNTAYYRQNTSGARAVYNTCQFYIRNTRTGLSKFPEERTCNEIEVLHDVFTSIQRLNDDRAEKYREKVFLEFEARLAFFGCFLAKAGADCAQVMLLWRCLRRMFEAFGLDAAAKYYGISRPQIVPYPTYEKSMLSYEVLDAILKYTKNASYYKCTSQVNQQAVKDACHAWDSFFEAIKAYKKNPASFTGRPRQPGYMEERERTAHFTNQVAKPYIAHGNFYVKFTNVDKPVYFGPAKNLPFSKDELSLIARFDVKPCPDGYEIVMVYEDKIDEPAVPEHPMRILAGDHGVNNFLAFVSNTGAAPFILDGKWLKSKNQWFNKEHARLMSDLTCGEDSKHSVKHSKKLDALSRDRDNQFRDLFYKYAHFVCRWAVKRRIEVIVLGHNKGQKQEINMGKANNQNFVFIPFTKFIQILETVAAKYGIPVITREESYTSRASFLDMDPIPTYHQKDGISRKFSGKRDSRWYMAKDGTRINADINGAANILRKQYPYAFDEVKDFTFLTKSVYKITRNMLQKAPKNGKTQPEKYHRRKSWFEMERHEERKQERKELWKTFGGKRRSEIKKDAIEKARVEKERHWLKEPEPIAPTANVKSKAVTGLEGVCTPCAA